MPENRHLVLFATALLIAFLVSKALKYKRSVDVFRSLPGHPALFKPLAFPGAVFPTSWWNPGLTFTWKWRRHLYANGENVSIIPFLVGAPVLYTSNVDVARQVVPGGTRSKFVKPIGPSRPLLLWGMNLIASEGETWRKHRRIAGPAFNIKAYRHVWSETSKIYHDMIDLEGWTKRSSVDVPVIQDLTTKIALLVMASAGFGFPFTWDAPPVAEDGSMSVQQATAVLSSSAIFGAVLPRWAWILPIPAIRQFRSAHTVLEQFMRKAITERKEILRKRSENGAGDDDGYNDVLSMLVHAGETEGKWKLDDQELMGNVFGMLFAGHESTAVTLAATLTMLALHQEIQEDALLQILEVVGQEREPTFEDFPKLNKVLAVFLEALRLYPAAYVSIREATEDTTVTLPNPQGQEGYTTVLIQKGSEVVVDWIGVQYNTRYFKDPYEFKPSRWHNYGSSDDVISAFGVGPRSCIGRKFAMTEVVCFLTHLLRTWRVEPLLLNGEKLDSWKERVTDAKMKVTLANNLTSLRFMSRAAAA